MHPIEIVPMGYTELPVEIILGFVEENSHRFTSETYDLLSHNCNNFSEEFVNFLTGNHIPDKILNLPNVFLLSLFLFHRLFSILLKVDSLLLSSRIWASHARFRSPSPLQQANQHQEFHQHHVLLRRLSLRWSRCSRLQRAFPSKQHPRPRSPRAKTHECVLRILRNSLSK